MAKARQENVRGVEKRWWTWQDQTVLSIFESCGRFLQNLPICIASSWLFKIATSTLSYTSNVQGDKQWAPRSAWRFTNALQSFRAAGGCIRSGRLLQTPTKPTQSTTVSLTALASSRLAADLYCIHVRQLEQASAEQARLVQRKVNRHGWCPADECNSAYISLEHSPRFGCYEHASGSACSRADLVAAAGPIGRWACFTTTRGCC